MSANNYIKIYKGNMEWNVEERDKEGDYVIEDLGSWADLESAIQCANEFMKENIVEGGLDIQV